MKLKSYKLISWNVNGIRAVYRKDKIKTPALSSTGVKKIKTIN